MGRRKSKKRVMKVRAQTVSKVFDCPFCNHSKTVECKLDKRKNIGTIHCRICTVSFQTIIHHLSEPVDVYSDWIDECQKVNAAQNGDEEEQIAHENEQDSHSDAEQEEQHHDGLRGRGRYDDEDDEEDDYGHHANHNVNAHRSDKHEMGSSEDEDEEEPHHQAQQGQRRLLQRNVDDEDDDEEEEFANNHNQQQHYGQGQQQYQQQQPQEQSEEDEDDSDDGHDYGQSAATPQYGQPQHEQYAQHDGYAQNQAMVSGSQEY